MPAVQGLSVLILAMLNKYWTLSFLLISIVPRSRANDFKQCLEEIRSGEYGPVGGLDNYGNPVDNITIATAISYTLCVEACGAAPISFSWSIFSQRFGAWVLPWLALISQLPFGASDNFDNLQSVLLCIGSPVLAAYSLALTTLNGRWIAQRFLPLKEHPNAYTIVRVLSSLQQAPLCIDDVHPHSLTRFVAARENQRWWCEFKKLLSLTHSWSISAAASITWVIVAYIFTVVDSFTGELSSGFHGQAVGIIWLWLLPIVVGWLQISPKCDSQQLHTALDYANQQIKREVWMGTNRSLPIHLTVRRVSWRRDESRSPPIFNYSRLFSWTENVEVIADCLDRSLTETLPPLSGETTIPLPVGEQPELPVARENEAGERLLRGCLDIEGVRRRNASRWGTGVWRRVLISAGFALYLQFGTTSAAVVVLWLTPTTGLGCRSAAYLAYGSLSTLIWLMCLSSSILSRYTLTSRSLLHHRRASIAMYLSIFLRRLGKVIATVNALGLVAISVFQFSSVFANCYCNSAVFWWGPSRAYNVIDLQDEAIAHMRGAWIGGEILAASAAFVFILFVNIFINPVFPRQGGEE